MIFIGSSKGFLDLGTPKMIDFWQIYTVELHRGAPKVLQNVLDIPDPDQIENATKISRFPFFSRFLTFFLHFLSFFGPSHFPSLSEASFGPLKLSISEKYTPRSPIMMIWNVLHLTSPIFQCPYIVPFAIWDWDGN